MHNARKLASFASRFGTGHGGCIGPIDGKWDAVATDMVDIFKESSLSLHQMIRSKVRVFSDRHDSIPSGNWSYKIAEIRNETGSVEKMDVSGREVHVISHIFPGATTINLMKEIENLLNGVESELFPDRITFMSMFNDIEHWQREYEESCLKKTREVVSCANRIRIGDWCLCGSAELRTWWALDPNGPKGDGGCCRVGDDIVT